MGCNSSTPQQPVAPPSRGGDGASNGGPAKPRSTAIKDATAKGSRNIDQGLRMAKIEEESKIKLLFLGAGESGKSTIFKQMHLLYGPSRPEDELRMFGVVARSNMVVAIRKLCTVLRNMGLESELDKESQENGGEGMTCRQAYDELMKYLVDKTATDSEPHVPPDDWVGLIPRAGLTANADAKQFLAHHKCIKIVWESKTMKRVWDRRASLNVVDGHKEFLDDITRIASPEFRPTKRDVLIARVRTTQVIVEKYRIKGMRYEMYDVGGQRSDRRKWIACFDDVTAVIFVAALSEYDQTLAEADANRMVEALDLFSSVVNAQSFTNSSFLLFLNKKDVFAEKIMYSDIAAVEHFSDYSGPTKDFDKGVSYFIKKFKARLINNELNDTFIHVTCATDTQQMNFVLDSTTSIIRSDNLKRSGFLMAD
mmetsp:Transcript_24819/g.44633  ORF Transcript_24819/g.44633 Transcript_24819/m.44633 type:complete len:424 (-) Transcript_24819:379-1650(-)|eukprot:CAMPEP_0201893498 /NCGR_PEP_ID=MMETSP0902-20130614/38773_1 /ASSEMBLY_ACC=CAM_ASM_000551 /TAXON_ID=420261 /ORGANISM="Thalassiosira antarctica, Strain CCMP982" /LENGTH=423 /DNA_ID=CAMNT_0048425309 /DNA_START=94 /DNA_END=1365 /DNA_ORIENTATION=+